MNKAYLSKLEKDIKEKIAKEKRPSNGRPESKPDKNIQKNNNGGKGEMELKQQIETISKDQPVSEVIKQLKPIFEKLRHFPNTDREAYLLDIKNRFGFNGDILKVIRKDYFYSETKEDNQVIVEDSEPYSEPVNGLELANEIEAILRKYTSMKESNYTAATLWVFLSYTYDNFSTLPKLLITSPTKRCGKTRLLEVLEGLVNRAFATSNTTPAAFFRVIDQFKPTILIDEADTFVRQNEELRGILNAGHTRRTAYVVRVADKSKGFEPEPYNVFIPTIIAMIGKPHGTITDRSIIIKMERKLPEVKLSKLSKYYYENNKELRQKLLRWAEDNAEALIDARVNIPEIGNDRAMDNWEPLFKIAELIGGDWPQKVNKAMLEIEGQNEDTDLKVELLKDIKAYFEEKETDRVWSEDLVEYLNGLVDKPYAEMNHGKGITPIKLSNLLKGFDIKPKDTRIGYKVRKGYNINQFTEIFARYITPEIKRYTATMASEQELQKNKNATNNNSVAFLNAEKMALEQECSAVAFRNGGNIEKTDKTTPSKKSIYI